MFLMHVTVMWWLMIIIFFVIGFVSFLLAFAEQLEHDLEQLDMDAKKSDKSNELNSKIYRIIDLHCEAKQLNPRITSLELNIFPFFKKNIFCRFAMRFSSFYRCIVIGFFIWSIINISCALLHVNVVSVLLSFFAALFNSIRFDEVSVIFFFR